MDLEKFSQKLLDETIGELKDEYAAIPQSVKNVMPMAAVLIGSSAIGGGLHEGQSQDLKHALSLMGNVKVGGRIALSELMLNKAADILGAGIKFARRLIGL